jgi:hypothetical protein
LITILIAGLAVHGAASRDYPGWRGPFRDGIAAAFAPLRPGPNL